MIVQIKCLYVGIATKENAIQKYGESEVTGL